MIELHTHLLHAIDDGPTSLTEALQLARALRSDGVRIAVATPHVSKAHTGVPALLDGRIAELRRALENAGVDLDVRSGAEIETAMMDGLDDARLRDLAIDRGSWLLIECPHVAYPFGMAGLIAELRERGFEVLLAHPERSPHIRDDPRLLGQLVAAGALAQVTAASLTRTRGSRSGAAAWAMLEAGLVHVVASDAHDTRTRAPALSAARALVAERLGGDLARAVTEDAPAAILAGADAADVAAEVGQPVRPSRPRGRFGGLRRGR